MAQSKRFYFWEGYWRSLAMFPDDASRGRFLMAMCEKAFLGTDPDFGDDVLSQVVWEIVSDQISESVAIGERSSKGGKSGGRPQKQGAAKPKENTPKRGVKRGVKSTPFNSAKNTVKNTVKSTPFNEEKGREGYGSETYPSPYSGEGGAGEGPLGTALPAPDGQGTLYQTQDPIPDTQDPIPNTQDPVPNTQETQYEVQNDPSLIDPNNPLPLVPQPIMPRSQVEGDGKVREDGPA